MSSGSELSESEFEIERILNHRKKGRNVEYLIRWKGYDSDEDEWIKESAIEGKNLISDYEKTLKKSPSRKVATKASKGKSAAVVEKSVLQSSKTTRSGTVKSRVVESETKGTALFDDTPVTTRSTFHSETRVWRSGGEFSDNDEDVVDYDDVREQVVKKSPTYTSDSSSYKSPPRRGLVQLSGHDIPFVIFCFCILFIVLSFVLERQFK